MWRGRLDAGLIGDLVVEGAIADHDVHRRDPAGRRDFSNQGAVVEAPVVAGSEDDGRSCRGEDVLQFMSAVVGQQWVDRGPE